MSSIPEAPEGSRPYFDERGRTDAETYLMGVQDGSVVACRHMKKLADIMLPRIRDGYKQWHYDPEKALRPISFLERFCRIPSGEKSNMPFFTVPYERCVIEIAFGFVDDDGKYQRRQPRNSPRFVDNLLICARVSQIAGASELYAPPAHRRAPGRCMTEGVRVACPSVIAAYRR